MEYLSLVLVTLVAVVVILISILLEHNRRNRVYIYPSGPTAWPLVGNLLQLIARPVHLQLSKWADKYGNIYRLKIACKNVLVINDPGLIRYIHASFPVSTNRFHSENLNLPYQSLFGFGVSERWLEQRRIFTELLCQLGSGHGSPTETFLNKEVNNLVESISEVAQLGQVKLTELFQKSVFSVIYGLTTGEDFPNDNPGLSVVRKNFLNSLKYCMRTGIVFLPWLKHVFPVTSGYKALVKAGRATRSYFEKCFNRKKIQSRSSHQSLLDHYFKNLYSEDSQEAITINKETKNWVVTFVLLFVSGAEATVSTLEWIIFYLCTHPDVQEKVFHEITQTVGTGMIPLAEKTRMPYLEAAILESIRKSPYVPFSIIHELSEDLLLNDYFLKSGTLLVANTFYVHNNKATWKDPENYRPDRFLGQSGSSLRNYIAPFYSGSRKCMGEDLARDIFYLFTAVCLQKFRFESDSDLISVKLWGDSVSGCVLPPNGMHIRISKRN